MQTTTDPIARNDADDYLRRKFNQFQEAMAFARATIAEIPRSTSVPEFLKLYAGATYRLYRLALSVQTTETATAAGAEIKKSVEDQMSVVESYGLLPVA